MYMNNYDKNEPSKYTMYLEANNLYGWAMSQYLPTGGFKWMTQREINKTNFASYKDDSNRSVAALVSCYCLVIVAAVIVLGLGHCFCCLLYCSL